MYAIIKHSGKQYKVSEGDLLNLDHFAAEKKSIVEITDVLAINDGSLKVGAPFVEGAKVVLPVISRRECFAKSLLLKNGEISIKTCSTGYTTTTVRNVNLPTRYTVMTTIPKPTKSQRTT